MTVVPISFLQAKQLTLDYLLEWMNRLPVAQRTMPTIVFNMRSWSIPQMISQVQTETQVGVRYVSFYIESLKQYTIVR